MLHHVAIKKAGFDPAIFFLVAAPQAFLTTWIDRLAKIVEDKKSLPVEPAPLRDRLGSHHAMEGKARFIFPVLISGLMYPPSHRRDRPPDRRSGISLIALA
jgi:hypothetical protein